MSTHTRTPSKGIGSETSNTDDSLSLDEIYGVLGNSRRRAVILTLYEHENIRKQELVELVTVSEYGMEREQVPGTSERQCVHTSLHQTHLPKLDNIGIIDWDEEGDRITLGSQASELDDFMPKLKETSLGDKLKQTVSALC